MLESGITSKKFKFFCLINSLNSSWKIKAYFTSISHSRKYQIPGQNSSFEVLSNHLFDLTKTLKNASCNLRTKKSALIKMDLWEVQNIEKYKNEINLKTKTR